MLHSLDEAPSQSSSSEVGRVDDQVVPMESNESCHRWKDCCGDANWKNSECFAFHRKDKLFFSVYVDDIMMVGHNESSAPILCEMRKEIHQHHDPIESFWDALKEQSQSTKK